MPPTPVNQPAYTGWLRLLPFGRWQSPVMGADETDCWRQLLRVAVPKHVVGVQRIVKRTGEKP
jgi:hypothetical protein